MNRDPKHIDRLFHDPIAGSGEQPPAQVWERIETALDEAKGVIAIRRKERRKRIAFYLLFVVAAGMVALLWEPSIRQAPAASKTASVGKNGHQDKTAAAIAKGMPSGESNAQPAEIYTDLVQTEKRQHTTVLAPSDPHREDVALQGNSVMTSQPGEHTGALADSLTVALSETMQPVEPVEYHPLPTAEPVPLLPQNRLKEAPQSIGLSEPANLRAKATPMVRVKKQSRFAVTLFFAPDVTTRNLEQNFALAFSPSLDERKEELLRTERNGALDFTVGARMEYKLNRRWSVVSGLSFSTNTIDIASKMVFARFDKDGALKFRFNLSSGYTYFKPKSAQQPRFLGDTAHTLSSSSILHYVNIPLALKYNFPSGRFTFSLQAGIAARFITSQSIDAVYSYNGAREKGRSENIQGLKRSYLNGVVGGGVEYALNHYLSLSFTPSFNFATTSINRDAPVKAYPNTLSLATGIKFSW